MSQRLHQTRLVAVNKARSFYLKAAFKARVGRKPSNTVRGARYDPRWAEDASSRPRDPIETRVGFASIAREIRTATYAMAPFYKHAPPQQQINNGSEV